MIRRLMEVRLTSRSSEKAASGGDDGFRSLVPREAALSADVATTCAEPILPGMLPSARDTELPTISAPAGARPKQATAARKRLPHQIGENAADACTSSSPTNKDCGQSCAGGYKSEGRSEELSTEAPSSFPDQQQLCSIMEVTRIALSFRLRVINAVSSDRVSVVSGGRPGGDGGSGELGADSQERPGSGQSTKGLLVLSKLQDWGRIAEILSEARRSSRSSLPAKVMFVDGPALLHRANEVLNVQVSLSACGVDEVLVLGGYAETKMALALSVGRTDLRRAKRRAASGRAEAAPTAASGRDSAPSCAAEPSGAGSQEVPPALESRSSFVNSIGSAQARPPSPPEEAAAAAAARPREPREPREPPPVAAAARRPSCAGGGSGRVRGARFHSQPPGDTSRTEALINAARGNGGMARSITDEADLAPTPRAEPSPTAGGGGEASLVVLRVAAETLKPGSQVGPCRLEACLGKGKFGSVYLAQNVETGQLEALKAVQVKTRTGSEMKASRMELNLQSKLSHENIVQVFGALIGPSHVFIRMECAGTQNMFRFLQAQGPLSEKGAQRVHLQVARAIEHCHVQGVAHRDIKPENIGVCSNDLDVKLLDFGLAVPATCPCRSSAGTIPFTAPEVMTATLLQPYDPAPTDVWSSSVLLIELLSGTGRLDKELQQQPGWQQATADGERASQWKVANVLLQMPLVATKLLSEVLEEHHVGLLALLAGTLRSAPGERWTASKVVSCSWLDQDGDNRPSSR